MRVVARKALLRLLEPLADFILSSGLSIHEVSSILREAVVRNVASQQLELAHRVNISGIAASTGIPRGEISRILKSTSNNSGQAADRHQPSTKKVLAAWQKNARYRTANGRPSDLKIYGRGATFDSLVRSHGRGIPTRAMLEELLRMRAIEVRPFQVVRLNTSLAAEHGMTPHVINAFGDRASELFTAMIKNIRNPESPVFVARVSGKAFPPDAIRTITEELSTKGADFLAGIRNTLNQQPEENPTNVGSCKASRLSIIIFCHEAPVKSNPNRLSLTARRNFRRSR
ncbi:MAG: DUF6502 family protein [Steroidobacteraceae bacterium]